MIVKCKDVYNKNTGAYLEPNSSNNWTKGYHYNVIELFIRKNGISYRINTDNDGLTSCSVIVLAKDFEIITSNIQIFKSENV